MISASTALIFNYIQLPNWIWSSWYFYYGCWNSIVPVSLGETTQTVVLNTYLKNKHLSVDFLNTVPLKLNTSSSFSHSLAENTYI